VAELVRTVEHQGDEVAVDAAPDVDDLEGDLMVVLRDLLGERDQVPALAVCGPSDAGVGGREAGRSREVRRRGAADRQVRSTVKVRSRAVRTVGDSGIPDWKIISSRLSVGLALLPTAARLLDAPMPWPGRSIAVPLLPGRRTRTRRTSYGTGRIPPPGRSTFHVTTKQLLALLFATSR
jgi:hypothetical protein